MQNQAEFVRNDQEEQVEEQAHSRPVTFEGLLIYFAAEVGELEEGLTFYLCDSLFTRLMTLRKSFPIFSQSERNAALSELWGVKPLTIYGSRGAGVSVKVPAPFTMAFKILVIFLFFLFSLRLVTLRNSIKHLLFSIRKFKTPQNPLIFMNIIPPIVLFVRKDTF